MHAHAHGQDSDWSARALAHLQARGLRNGGARRTVIEHLGAQPCCRSAQEIYDGIRDGGGRIGIASVYRTLDQLVELRLLQRVELGDGIARYDGIAGAFTGGNGRFPAYRDPKLRIGGDASVAFKVR